MCLLEFYATWENCHCLFAGQRRTMQCTQARHDGLCGEGQVGGVEGSWWCLTGEHWLEGPCQFQSFTLLVVWAKKLV